MITNKKVAVIFYSLDGNTRVLAQNMARTIDADLIELKLARPTFKYSGPWKYFFGGYHALKNQIPDIASIKQNIDNYDLLIIGTPVWAGRMSPVIRSFLTKSKIVNKKIALFCSYGGGLGSTFDQMKELLRGNEIIGQEDFQALNRKQETLVVLKAQSWVKVMVGKA